MSIWSTEIKELERLFESFKDQLPDLEKELGQLIHSDDPNVILLYSRRSLEVIITDLCECELKRERGTEPLKGIIDRLNKEKKIPAHIASSMYGLNEISTYGTHPREFDPEQVKPVLINLDIVLKWYLKYKGFHVLVKPEQEVQNIDIKPVKAKRIPFVGMTFILRPYIIIAIVILGAFLYLQNRSSRKKWAKENAVNEIEQLINKSEITAAYNLVNRAKRFISNEPKFRELSSLISSDLSILSDPPGAIVYFREYSDTAGKWKKLGRTPVSNVNLPGSSFWATNSFYLIKFVKSGYEDVLAVTSSHTGRLINVKQDTVYRRLFRSGEIPPGMIYVEGLDTNELKRNFLGVKHGFFIDRCEVTNKSYKEFIDKGGYRNRDYWKNDFNKDGRILSWDEAMDLFVDKSGRPGPYTWEGGDYPEGEDNYPVSGVSWYEAAAYAEYAGKNLPTKVHWSSAARCDLFDQGFYSKLISNSNFYVKGPAETGKYPGITNFGAYDMAGNVREWCWNETPFGRIIRGGGWNDQGYLFSYLSQLPSFDRSEKNGFRCVKYIENEKIPENYFKPIYPKEIRDYTNEKPVDDNVFKIYSNMYLYDKIDLDSKIEETDYNHQDWTIEKITFNAAYGKNRVIAYLYLPVNSNPPYQTLVFFPGAYALGQKEFTKDIENIWLIDYLIKSGRAVMCPIYFRTFERIDEQEPVELSTRYETTDLIKKWTQDFSRSVDYLETRLDIDTNRIGYYGSSFGGAMGAIIPAIEHRCKVNILITGGLQEPSPDFNIVSYVARIKIPTLMLNGKYDFTFPYEKSVMPFYDNLGTPFKDKKIVTYETDHYVPKNEMIKEVLAWCDKYFGPVNYKNQSTIVPLN